MANKKISLLTSAAALVGSEVLPIVQSGSTVKTTVQDVADLFGGGSIKINTLAGANNFNSINNANYAQSWSWNTLGANIGFELASSSTAAASNIQTLFNVLMSGANATTTQTTYGAIFKNQHTGTTSTNVAAKFTAISGTYNYAALFVGLTGFGTLTPTAQAHFGASSASASTAPIKFTTGTVMTSAEVGAFEYTTPTLFFTNGGGQRQEIPQIQQSRVSTQFDKTSNTTLGNITGLTATLVAGKIYRFEANLYCASDVASGVKFAIAGTATATSIRYAGVTIDNNNSTSQATALGSAVGALTSTTGAVVRITGLIVVNTAGTLTVQMAQNVSGVVASSVLTGSTFICTEIA